MTCVWDWQEQNTYFMMWDARTLHKSVTPILSVKMESRIPYGFHTYFVPDSDKNNFNHNRILIKLLIPHIDQNE